MTLNKGNMTLFKGQLDSHVWGYLAEGMPKSLANLGLGQVSSGSSFPKLSQTFCSSLQQS